jgi:hypothetical protein
MTPGSPAKLERNSGSRICKGKTNEKVALVLLCPFWSFHAYCICHPEDWGIKFIRMSLYICRIMGRHFSNCSISQY